MRYVLNPAHATVYHTRACRIVRWYLRKAGLDADDLPGLEDHRGHNDLGQELELCPECAGDS